MRPVLRHLQFALVLRLDFVHVADQTWLRLNQQHNDQNISTLKSPWVAAYKKAMRVEQLVKSHPRWRELDDQLVRGDEHVLDVVVRTRPVHFPFLPEFPLMKLQYPS